MGCIRVDKITEYLCEPLRKCLKDEDPYVRKTAAVCVAKLYDINAQLVEDQGFLDQLKDLLSDSNPMVIIVCLEANNLLKGPVSDRSDLFFRSLPMLWLRCLKSMIPALVACHWSK